MPPELQQRNMAAQGQPMISQISKPGVPPHRLDYMESDVLNAVKKTAAMPGDTVSSESERKQTTSRSPPVTRDVLRSEILTNTPPPTENKKKVDLGANSTNFSQKTFDSLLQEDEGSPSKRGCK